MHAYSVILSVKMPPQLYGESTGSFPRPELMEFVKILNAVPEIRNCTPPTNIQATFVVESRVDISELLAEMGLSFKKIR